MKRKIVVLLLAGMAVLGTSGCYAESTEEGYTEPARGIPSDNGLFETRIELMDGREVPCIWIRQGYSGGLDCDWDAAE